MYAQLNAQVIYYEKCGEGPRDVILLHGNGESHEIFTELAGALLDRFTVYLPDTRGHGLSATPKEYHYRDMAEDLINFSDFLALPSPVVVGFSDGAITAMLAAMQTKSRFSHLYLCGGNLTPKGLTRKALHDVKKSFRKDKSNPYTALLLNEPNISADMLSAIDVPCTVIAGEKDVIKEAETKLIAESIPGAKLLILPGEDHGSYVEHSTRLAKLIM